MGEQASARRETSYTVLVQSPARRARIANAAHKCGELGSRNGGLHGVRWSEALGNGCTRLRVARNLVGMAAGVGNAFGCLR
jgi:hypothetical protein